MSFDVVLKIFIKMRVIVKSRDFLSLTFIGHASKPYSNTGIHLLLIKNKIVSSDALLPRHPYIALKERKNDFFALSNPHLNLYEETM